MAGRTPDPRTCEQCGAGFLALESNVRRGNGRFCSRSCEANWRRVNDPVWFDRRSAIARNAAPSGAEHYKWRGGRKATTRGYVRVLHKGHPRATSGYVFEHVMVAERALGKPLPAGAVVHHVNGEPGDNRSCNLAVLPDTGYHMALHARLRVLRLGGDPFRQWTCSTCQRLLDFAEFGKTSRRWNGVRSVCLGCRAMERKPVVAGRPRA